LAAPAPLPAPFAGWFAARGWEPRPHQLAMVEAAQAGRHALLVAPTGAGKTLAGFLPSLLDLAHTPAPGLHTLYVSPLKALAADIARNLEMPVREMGLAVRIETRTGDTPAARKSRQRHDPPHLLLTTPESLSLLISYPEAEAMLRGLSTVVLDEIHAFGTTKRGDLLALALARLQRINPRLRRVGLSATIADAAAWRRWLAPAGEDDAVRVVAGVAGATPEVDILVHEQRIPWAGHAGRHAIRAVYAQIAAHRTTIVFANTRWIAEQLFQDLWAINDANLPIALHHGSLAMDQRQRVEGAMAAGQLRAIVATSSLDLGLDWGAVDLVIQMGAPKGSSRLLQRIGRANHRLDEPSRAILVPGNRFEYLEAHAARDAVLDGALDADAFRPGALDVLAQHLTGLACAAPFTAEDAYAEVRTAAPYAALSRADFDDTLAFTINGGYALRAYDRFQRLVPGPDGRYRIAHPRLARQYRLNAGAIIEEPLLEVRFRMGRSLGRVEEWFASQLEPGDTFIFAGQMLQFESIDGGDMVVRRSAAKVARIPSYAGGRLPLSTALADRVRDFLAEPALWARFPDDVRDWLEIQRRVSQLPPRDGLLVETFPHEGRWFLSAYSFEGRAAHQTLGLLLTRRMESLGLAPLGFVGNDYVLSVWSLDPVDDPAALFSPAIVLDELAEWMARSSLLKRTFRDVAIISGLIERQVPGERKRSRQLSFSADLIFDVLRKHEPGHLLLRATWADARGKLTDIGRVEQFLARIAGCIVHRRLDRVSPLAVPALIQIGQEQVHGSAEERLLLDAERLIAAATR